MTKHLLVINLIVYLATWVLAQRGIDLNWLCGLHFVLDPNFHVWQFVTYMFLHGGFTHILFNMFALWMFGSVIERVWDRRNSYFITSSVAWALVSCRKSCSTWNC